MNIWLDIYHIPQLNYFIPLIHTLSKEGHTQYVTVLDRGRLAKIARKELADIPGVKLYVIGRHRMTKWSVIFEANIFRLILLFLWALPKHIDISLSLGFHHGFIALFKRQPAFSFHDDPQASDHKLLNRFCIRNHAWLYCLPENVKLADNDILMPALKEWAYLNPRVFKPNVKVLDEYNVKPKEYIFLREVSVGTFNYAQQKAGAILGVKHFIPKNMKVLFSLEEKNRRTEYPDDWILLQEPVQDIHSLIYYSVGLASSGDSMAREAAELGVPSYYLGTRHSMPANYACSQVAEFNSEKTIPFSDWVKRLIMPDNMTKDEFVNQLTIEQQKLRYHIDEIFMDVNDYMLRLIHDRNGELYRR